MRKKDDPRRGQRVHRGAAQTAINTYTRDGRTVTLIGVLHMAEEDYYLQVRKRIDELESAGAIVHYEKSSSSTEFDGTETEDERTAFTAFRASLVERYKPFRMLNLGWQAQPDSVLDEIGPNWRTIDVGALNVVRLFGPKCLLAAAPVAKPQQMTAMVEGLEPGSRKYKMVRAIARAKFIGSAKKDRTKHDDVAQDVMYLYREAAAALAILETRQDVVSIWGAPHLVGLDEILTRNDFILTHSEWLTAIGDKG